MSKQFWANGLKLNIHSPRPGTALMILALTQIPVAIKTAAEVACIGEISHQTWKTTKSHKGVNVIAIQKCNGKN